MTQYKAFTIKFVAPTSTKGARISVTDNDNGKRKFIPYDHNKDSTLQIAEDYLINQGFELVGYANGKDYYTIFAKYDWHK